MWFRKLCILAVLFSTLGYASAQAKWWYVNHANFEEHAVERLTDINPGSSGITNELFYRSSYVGVFDDALFFQADDGVHGAEVWRYDGEQAELLTDLLPGSQGSYPRNFVSYRGALYFSATGPSGRELYRFDGNAVALAADIGGPMSSSPTGLVVVNGVLYFRAQDPDHGHELWRFNGNEATLAADVNPGPADGVSSCCARFEDEVIFAARNGQQIGLEPWSFDGAVLKLLGDINPNGDSVYSLSRRVDSAVFQNSFYFSANDGDANHGTELWRYDGDTAEMVEDFFPGSEGSHPGQFEVFNNALYFSARGFQGVTLHRFNGDTIAIADNIPTPVQLRVFDNRLYFSGTADTDHNVEPFVFDGYTSRMIQDINLTNDSGGRSRNSFPSAFTPPAFALTPGVVDQSPSIAQTNLGKHLYFFATDGVHGYELWRLKRRQGIVVDTVLAADLFEEFWEQPVTREQILRRNVIVVSYLFDGDNMQRLQTRETNLGTLLGNGRALRHMVTVDDALKSLAVTSVVFDAASGDVLASGTSVLRSSGKEDAATLVRKAAAFGNTLKLERVKPTRLPDDRNRLKQK